MVDKGAFRMYDLDEDGFVGKAEMLCIVDSVYRMIGNSKSFPDDEATPEMRVEKVFLLMDMVCVSDAG
jgi:neuronal calcium sensor 1